MIEARFSEAAVSRAGFPPMEGWLVFRNTAPGKGYGRIAAIPLDQREGPRYVTSLVCDRAYMAAGRGICLGSGWLTFQDAAYLFDAGFQRLGPAPVVGDVPSRARVSPNGLYAATTLFAGHDQYASAGFSTRTRITDTASGAVIADLEEFSVSDNGRPFWAPDFNFWGISFTVDASHFYATLGSGGRTYLVYGDLASRTVEVLREGVECPSLSPDGTRIAFKKRFMSEGRVNWQLTVLDLSSHRETPLAERRSVDDQAEWLDNQRVLYALPHESDGSPANGDLWEVAADGSGEPRLFLAYASSPAVIRQTP